MLAVVDRKTPIGRRDYAMFMLLTAYGLRGVELARLRLDDIDWRNRKLHIRGRKSGNNTTYPLARSVDGAIVDYLRHGRPISSCREVFLSATAPFRPLANGVALTCHIVKYFQQVGITVNHPGTHIFRYSCAQRLFEERASLKVIGDYLGHADPQTTLRYVKIDLGQLREVAVGDAEELLTESPLIELPTPGVSQPSLAMGASFGSRPIASDSVVSDNVKSYSIDRGQAERLFARHLEALGGSNRSDYRFHRAIIRRFLNNLSESNENSTVRSLILSEQRLLDWLIQEARRRTTESAGRCFAALSRYVRELVRAGLLETDLMLAFQTRYGKRGWPVLAGALQESDPIAALKSLQVEMPAPGPIATDVHRYLELHRAMGKDYSPEQRLLPHLDRYLESQGILSADAVTPETIERWANRLTGNRRTRIIKVRMAYRFFEYLLGLGTVSGNPASPVLHTLGRRPKIGLKPFIFSQEQIASILDAAQRLPANSLFPLRAETCSTIFLLLYGLGLRMGEACRLLVRDVSIADATLFIGETKFHKSRYVAFGPKIGNRLQQFLELRRSLQPSLGDDDPLFVAMGPNHVDQSGLNKTFRAIADGLGIRGTSGQESPRPHDLRHTFAVHRLLRWYREGADVQSKLPILSTFMGHTDPTSTQVYLTMTSALLQEANTRFYQSFGCVFDLEEPQ